MGMFDTEDAFLTQERDKLSAQYAGAREEQNPFRAAAGAFKRYQLDSQGNEKIRQTEALAKKYDITNENPSIRKRELFKAGTEARQIGDTEAAVQYLTLAQGITIATPDPGKWTQVEITGPDNKPVGALMNSTTSEYQVPGLGKVDAIQAMEKGYKLLSQKDGATPSWNPSVLYIDGKPVQASHDKASNVWSYNDGTGPKAVHGMNLPINVSTLKPTEGKTPSNRNIRDGRDIVNQEWNPETKEWFEVGRGSAADYGSGNTTWKNLFDRYEKQMSERGVNKGIEDLRNIKLSAREPGGVASKSLQTALSNMMGGKTRAVHEIQRMASFGDIDERISNAAVKFINGEYSDTNKKAALAWAHAYEKDVLRPQWQEINDRIGKIADSQGVPRNEVLMDLPNFRDFDSMGKQELSSLAQTPGFRQGLDIFEEEAFRQRLIKFTK